MIGYKCFILLVMYSCFHLLIGSSLLTKSADDQILQQIYEKESYDSKQPKIDLVDDNRGQGMRMTSRFRLEDVMLQLYDEIRILKKQHKHEFIENQNLRKDVNLLKSKHLRRCSQKQNKSGGRTLRGRQKSLDIKLHNSQANRIRRGTPDILPNLKPAFHAQLTRTIQGYEVADDMTIIYNDVITNEGSHYDANSGTFTAPVSGVYVFHNSLETAARTYLSSSFVVNGAYITSGPLAQGSQGNGYGSNTVVLRLQSGDKVWVKVNEHPTSSVIYGYDRDSFSGYLL